MRREGINTFVLTDGWPFVVEKNFVSFHNLMVKIAPIQQVLKVKDVAHWKERYRLKYFYAAFLNNQFKATQNLLKS